MTSFLGMGKLIGINFVIHLMCRKQGIEPTKQQTQQRASHLMDLLDISLGAASISGPSQASDPWGMPISEQKQV